MSHLALTLQVLAATAGLTADRVLGRPGPPHDDDAGLSTLEVVVIALGLFLIAGILVAAITTAVTSRLAQIN